MGTEGVNLSPASSCSLPSKACGSRCQYSWSTLKRAEHPCPACAHHTPGAPALPFPVSRHSPEQIILASLLPSPRRSTRPLDPPGTPRDRRRQSWPLFLPLPNWKGQAAPWRQPEGLTSRLAREEQWPGWRWGGRWVEVGGLSIEAAAPPLLRLPSMDSMSFGV